MSKSSPRRGTRASDGEVECSGREVVGRRESIFLEGQESLLQHRLEQILDFGTLLLQLFLLESQELPTRGTCQWKRRAPLVLQNRPPLECILRRGLVFLVPGLS